MISNLIVRLRRRRPVILRAAGALVALVVACVAAVEGLWVAALAAPVLVFVPHMLRGAVAERRTKRALDAELAVILGGSRG